MRIKKVGLWAQCFVKRTLSLILAPFMALNATSASYKSS